jgi:hypothetical protein
LNSATISGIEVMATRWAARAPMMEPTMTPTAIHWNSMICWENSVTTTAMNMPSADSRLPRTAVSGEDSSFRPKTNSAAATM